MLFHDGVRPLITHEMLTNCIEALKKYNAVCTAVPAVNTVAEVKDNFIVAVPDRSKLMRSQTPQGFRLETIKKAYDIALKDPNLKVINDCSVLKEYLPDEKIYVVEGCISNIKLTHEADLFAIEKLFQAR